MKHIITGAAMILLFALILCGAEAETETRYRGEWYVNAGETELLGGEKIALSAKDLGWKPITWWTSEPEIIRVDNRGNVTAADVETKTEAYVTAENENGILCWRLMITPAVKSMTLEMNGQEIGDSVTIDITNAPADLIFAGTVFPADADQTIFYKVDTESIIGDNGELHIENAGKYIVTAESADGKIIRKIGIKAVKCVRDISIGGANTVVSGQYIKLLAAVEPADATELGVTWRSTDETVAKVDIKGTVLARDVSEATDVEIRAIAKDGNGAVGTYRITVLPKVSYFVFSMDSQPMTTGSVLLNENDIGNTYQLGADAEPADALEGVHWSSSNNSVARVSQEGEMLIVGRGDCRITATAQDRSKASSYINVSVRDTDPYEYYMEIDKTNQVVRVYAKDDAGRYTRLLRRMPCSTGEYDNALPDGLYRMDGLRREWITTILPGVNVQWATRIVEHIWFHSLPYSGYNPNKMDVSAYEELGTACSHGCIRLLAADCKWICKNVRAGTSLYVGKFPASDSEKTTWPKAEGTWDPTDDNPDNPYYDSTYTSLVE